MSTPQDVIAAELAEWRGMEPHEESAAAASIIDALAAKRFAVVEIPEPITVCGRPRWMSDESYSGPAYIKWAVGINEAGMIHAWAKRGKGPESRGAEDHAAFAAALIAAAQAVTR